MKLISFYTKDTPYEDLALHYRASALEVGLEPIIYPVENLGVWAHNCNQKAAVLYRAYLEYPNDRILYTDIDARFEKYPTDIENHAEDFDIGFHMLRGEELLSGTLVFDHTYKACLLLRKWVYITKHHLSTWDQKILQRVVQANSIKVYHLDPAHCYIFDISRRLHPKVKPVIIHHQISRKYRRIINEAGKV